MSLGGSLRTPVEVVLGNQLLGEPGRIDTWSHGHVVQWSHGHVVMWSRDVMVTAVASRTRGNNESVWGHYLGNLLKLSLLNKLILRTTDYSTS